MSENTNRKTRLESIAVKAFAAVILAGAVLLVLPISSGDGQWTGPLTALFTATSATCVTGLVVVDTGSYFSSFGQLVILCLIQLGGLGIMTISTFLLILVGRRLSMREEFVLMDSLGSAPVKGLRSLVWRVVLFVVFFEAAGAAIMAYRLITVHGYASAGAAVYQGLFHSISAFCNCGLSLYRDSFTGLRSDKVIVLTIMALIILGGLGFLVLHNVFSIRFWRRNRVQKGRLTLHSKIVLSATCLLIAAGWIAFMVLEWNGTLDGMRWADKITTSLFQAVTPRTAGFNLVDTAQLRPSTRLLTMVMMFIGGSPCSTAGGVKTTTIVVMILTVAAMMRGREDTDLFGRSISMRVVREAVAIFIMGILCVVFFFGILLLTEDAALLSAGRATSDELLFETISAAATVGLSTGVTSHLSVVGKLCIIACMFIGRLGPLTIALTIGKRAVTQAIRYPEQEVVVG